MGICRTVLTALVILVLSSGSAFPARPSGCLACHASHDAGLGNCTGCHRGNDRTDRKRIAHHELIPGRFAHFRLTGSPVVVRGKELIERLACRRCHLYQEKGNPLAADLGRYRRDAGPQAMFDSIRFPVPFMPNFHLDDGQSTAVVNAILAATQTAGGRLPEAMHVVHFEDQTRREGTVFVRQCGPCHRLLSERFGGLGVGDIGPNLSGLFSGFYPDTHPDGGRWTPEALKKWLENPRSLRSVARMQPVRLTAGEFEGLWRSLRIDRPDGQKTVHPR